MPIGSRPSQRIQKRATKSDSSTAASSTNGHCKGNDQAFSSHNVEADPKSEDQRSSTASAKRTARSEKPETCGSYHQTSGADTSVPAPGITAGHTTPGSSTSSAMRELRKYFAEMRKSINPSSSISAAASPVGASSQGQDKASAQCSADSKATEFFSFTTPNQCGQPQSLHGTCGTSHQVSGATIAGPTLESIPVVTTKALDIDPPPGLLSGVSHSAHPKTTEQSVKPSSGVSQLAHPATIEPPPGLLAGVSCSAHPESSSTKAAKSEAMLPSVSSPKMALLYASASMHRALTANANQANRCSINRYLGWPRVSLSIGIPGYGEEEGDVHVNNDDNKCGARNSSNYECHNRRYDRTSLLNVWNNSDLYVWDPWIYTSHPGFSSYH